ncbi:hypothetical protein C8J56DRAFT_897091 [Mycena floridula]|nr:hypothetical protein C8J56DRAFT_897091 [Mycena floridula]
MHKNSSAKDVVPKSDKRSRTPIACSACRRRKIKCQIDRDSYQKQCHRCARLKLTCEYLAVAEDTEASPSSDGSSEPSNSPNTSTDPESSISYIPSDNRTSYIYRPQTRPELASAYCTSDPAPGTSQMIEPATREPLYDHGYAVSVQGLGNHPRQILPQYYQHVPRPVPESVVYEAETMQTFQALSRLSPRREDRDQRIILQQMYQPSRKADALVQWESERTLMDVKQTGFNAAKSTLRGFNNTGTIINSVQYKNLASGLEILVVGADIQTPSMTATDEREELCA